MSNITMDKDGTPLIDFEKTPTRRVFNKDGKIYFLYGGLPDHWWAEFEEDEEGNWLISGERNKR